MADNKPVCEGLDGATAKRWQSMMKSLREGHHSDFVMKCGDEVHPVHKNIMSLQSGFFGCICNGSFKEAEEGVLHLPDDDPLAVRAMIDYIYLGNYDNIMMEHSSNEKPRDVTEFLPLHAKAYVLGDKYELEGLRSTATSKIAETLKADPNSVFTESFWHSAGIVYS